MQKNRILIVGGVAGGASCAARARRLCEQCEIVVFDKGPYVSFANCGLPYFVGDVIGSEEQLLVASPELFKQRFNIDVRVESEVIRIGRERKTIEVRDMHSGEIYSEGYNALVLATGATPIQPPIEGIGLPGIHVLRTIPDSRKIRAATVHAASALIVGGGFIGLEMAENLARLGLAVSLIELAGQVLPPLDPEMAEWVKRHLEDNAIELYLGEGVSTFRQHGSRIIAETDRGNEICCDIVILGIGIKPETTLAKAAGLTLGSLGGIRVDEFMRTSDPHIWAVGDVVESRNRITGEWQISPLAGPANRQGRIAATAILRGTTNENCMRFDGVLGTAVCGVFGLTVATTGVNEKMLRKTGRTDYEKVYLHPGNHASYFPGAKPIHIKLLFATRDGRILGAQAVGEADVARRIDVIATAMQFGGTVFDLEEAELCYAPQFGAAKDPVNFAGMVAANHLRGDLPLADWNLLPETDALVVDVRSIAEYDAGCIPGSRNIPLESLRDRLHELPKDREIWLVCGVGQRAYYALRVLLQNGYRVKILGGGIETYQTFSRVGPLPAWK